MGWSQAMWAWRPLFRVRVIFFATFPERSRSRPRQTIGPFRKELKNVTIVIIYPARLIDLNNSSGRVIVCIDTMLGLARDTAIRQDWRSASLEVETGDFTITFPFIPMMRQNCHLTLISSCYPLTAVQYPHQQDTHPSFSLWMHLSLALLSLYQNSNNKKTMSRSTDIC